MAVVSTKEESTVDSGAVDSSVVGDEQADKTKIDPNRMRQLELTIFEKIRQKTHGADDEGKTLKRIFKHFDQENYGTVNQPNF